MINELLNLVFNTNIVVYPSIGLVLLLYYIAEFSTSMVLVLYCIQKASIAHHCWGQSKQASIGELRTIGGRMIFNDERGQPTEFPQDSRIIYFSQSCNLVALVNSSFTTNCQVCPTAIYSYYLHSLDRQFIILNMGFEYNNL